MTSLRPVGWHQVKEAFGRLLKVQFLIRKRKASRVDLEFALRELIESASEWLDAIKTSHTPITDGEVDDA